MSSDKVDLSDPNISLAEKWRRYSAHKRRTGISSKAHLMHAWGPVFYFFTIMVGSSWLFVDVLPSVYVDEREGLLLPLRLLLLLLTAEVAVNWAGIRYVSSAYLPAIHGTKPTDFPDVSVEPKTQDNNGKRNATNGESSGQGVMSDGETQSRKSEAKAIDMDYAPPGRAKPGSYDGFSYRMLVATSLPTADGEIERKPFPYWSWVPCLMCQRLRPPRCHHCVLCKQCVLKRDHHCYFTGKCVGLHNFRFFVVFLVWAFLLTSFATFHILPFIFHIMIPRYGMSVWDIIFPIPLFRGLLGYISLMVTPLVMVTLFIIFCNVISFSMSLSTFHLFYKGKTSFERDNSIKVLDTRSLGGKLRSVFGDYWWLNFLVPTYPWIKPVEDAVLWPHIKPC